MDEEVGRKLGEEELKRCKDEVSNLALDIGGTLIKMVYFSTSSGSSCSTSAHESISRKDEIDKSSGHFLKFETEKISECINFISSKHLRHYETLLIQVIEMVRPLPVTQTLLRPQVVGRLNMLI